ncbi:UDP-N-acetylmuramoyl-L-alanine--D-glutamate ligase [Candidatus Magnetaquicoccus inordinatus]|uniref:UDP-N-acetylmuramoyl-L-alanine--D-glutamate ligase n=1 Tax=Candidatus Magnetaquicoccus inordinatus TaxID=2496818 RepID=UPI00102C1966|nr:UDP-N-acetylmuramoyl-L-alanine--D-glutamate ligase [Candidatus Magnetaquicoccus inordinatus]
MTICELIERRVGILGLGVEGQAALQALRAAGYQQTVPVLVEKPLTLDESWGPVQLCQGAAAEAVLPELDVLIRSPGFAPGHPWRQQADRLPLLQTTPTNLFLAEVRRAGLPVIGITGSKGKSTTSTLLYESMRAAGLPVCLLGNIGVAALAQLPEVLAEDKMTVLEMSSYQCADLQLGPSIAVVLNLFPEHMDWHGSVDAYYLAKMQIGACQLPGDLLRIDQRAVPWMQRLRPVAEEEMILQERGYHIADGFFCRGTERLFATTAMRLPGRHNWENGCAVLAAAELVGVGAEVVQGVMGEFSGLPYRMSDLGVRGGIRWINDAISTAPEATVAALQAFLPQVATLIVGGKDRGYDYAPLVERLAESAVRTLILLPDSGRRVAELVRACSGLSCRIIEVADLPEAVQQAKRWTEKGWSCLFSPGAPSYNQFANFSERGQAFLKAVGNGDDW